MIGSTRGVRVFAYGAPVDLRKGYEGLGALVRNELGRDVLSGDLFLFVNARRGRAKVIFFDGTGLCIYMKRLARGRFAAALGSRGGRSACVDDDRARAISRGRGARWQGAAESTCARCERT